MKLLRSKIAKNASWIIICKTIQAILSLVISILTARYLGPSNFGVINYAISVIAFLVPIMQLGFNNVMIQEIVEKPLEEGKIVGSCLTACFLASILCMIGAFGFVMIANAGEKETIIVCVLYSTILLFQSIEMIQYWFQAKLLSKHTSIVMLIAYFVVSIYKIVLLVLKSNIYWFAISYSIDYAIIAVSLLIIYKKLGGQKLEFSASILKRILKKSKFYIISGMMVTIFANTDKIMIKFMIDDAATGYYSAAVASAGMTSFIFVAIIDSFRPVILENKKADEKEYEKNVTRLYSIIIYFSLIQCILFASLAKYIILILYGNQYLDAVTPLRIITWYSTFSYLGAVRNVWILAEQKHSLVIFIDISGAIANIILNFIFIPLWGISGAAFASLITQIFTNVIIGYIIKPIRYNNKLMVKGLNPKHIIELFNKKQSKEKE